MYDYCELKPMALQSTGSWIAREQHKNSDQQLFVAEQRPPPKVANKQHTQTERFTQTEYRANCVEVIGTGKDTVMFEQSLQQQPQAVPVQMYSTIDKKDLTPDKGNNLTEFPFCYNVLQKVHQTQGGSPTTTAVASISADDKTCYRFDVAQPFSYNYALVNQMSLAAAASTATFKCDVCGLVFAHLSLLNHHKRIHNNNGDVSPERNFTNENQNEVIKVQLKTSASKPRNCNRCGGEVDCDHSNNLKKKVSKYVKCENCQSGPTSTTTSTTTNGSFQSASSSPEPTDSPPDVVNIPSKNMHLVKHGLATVTKCHKCNGSGIIFVGGARPPPNDKPFRCNVCDGSFSRYSSLWSHKRLHSGDKPFKCDMCGLTFARAAYLKNHLRVHSGEKPYKCNVCGMQFSQSPHLKNHERIHSGERPYQCEVCEKTFARHSTLWNHRRIHTGEKPYRCNICGSAFNQATHLKNHGKVHTGEKPHRCDICEVGFSDRFALKRHRLIHEKYGRTSNNTQTPSQQAQQTSTTQQSTSQMGELYKCEVAFPGQQPSEVGVSTSVGFSGSNQPSSTSRASQPQQTEMYKCDVGTSVSFPPTAQQSAQSSNSTSVDAANNTLPFQGQQASQQQNGQQTTQMSEMYKYDVSTSVAFPGQTQPPQTQTQAITTTHTQYDVGTSTVTYSGQSQQSVSQEGASQSSTSVCVDSNNFSETIIGS
ncbi:zinc finger protein 724-like [Macrosteles quadrilineatus]|uniref:zinc finger protein 724-like n=1 Tax=Macrosteles quadrilineatus TaxID=74068 RepID=UPI0023E30FE0|nr:zinc finger protein 724-like [Macrosteles quadrilineatus]